MLNVVNIDIGNGNLANQLICTNHRAKHVDCQDADTLFRAYVRIF